MPVNRQLWKSPFTKLQPWPCPKCQSGNLSLKKDSFQEIETGYSIEAHGHEAWEPDWIDQRFSALLACQNDGCGEVVFIGGVTKHVEDHDWEKQELNWAKLLNPVSIYPAPHIFMLPEGCPPDVKSNLERAFLHFWSDTGSSANRLRAAVESLLTEQGIPSAKIGKPDANGKSKKYRLTLHDRIGLLAASFPEEADYIFAIKWLGNAGSHSTDELSQDDLLDGFELFEVVLESFYSGRKKRLNKIAKSINTRKGRPKSR